MALANTDDVDRRAIKANESIQGRNDDLEEVEQGRDGASSISLFAGVNLSKSEYKVVHLRLGLDCSTE